MSDRDPEFRVRPGRIRSTRSPDAKSVLHQVLRAAQKSGHVSAGPAAGKRGGVYGRSTFGRGRGQFARARLFGSQRRVVVKARIARHQGKTFRSAPLTAHLSYLKREGVSRDGEKGVMFGVDVDRADDKAFAERCQDDRHHFRFIVSPEDASDMEDLKAFTRDLVRQMEADLGTKLDWVAADHWNTDNPHVHLLVRGIDDTGADLVIARDYISKGLRSRAEELVEIELGPKPEHAIRSALEKEITTERWTRLDAEIRYHADDTGAIDLRPTRTGPDDPEIRRLMIGRLQHLETMELATATGPGEWMLGLDAEPRLRDLGMRGDIIKTMHRAFTERGQDRGFTDFLIDGATVDAPIVGRLVDKGLHDELNGSAYAVIDGIDGRAHHVVFRGLEALEQSPAIGGIVEVRRFGGPTDPRPTLMLALRSDLDLAAQVAAPGATWLDHRLLDREPTPLADSGFGAEARDALERRTEHLVGQGLARRDGQRILLQRNLLATLRQRELDATGEQLAAETGADYRRTAAGEEVSGTLRRQLRLSSGRFAMIDAMDANGGLGFRLVPWSRDMDRKLGQHINGIAREDGGLDLGLGRKRDCGLGI